MAGAALLGFAAKVVEEEEAEVEGQEKVMGMRRRRRWKRRRRWRRRCSTTVANVVRMFCFLKLQRISNIMGDFFMSARKIGPDCLQQLGV